MTWNECPVCFEEFSFDASRNQPKTPILGSICGHSCCRLCVQMVHEQNNKTNRTTIVKCPICCRPSFRVDILVPNLGLCDAIENSKKVEAAAAAATKKRTKHKIQAEPPDGVISLLSDDEDDDDERKPKATKKHRSMNSNNANNESDISVGVLEVSNSPITRMATSRSASAVLPISNSPITRMATSRSESAVNTTVVTRSRSATAVAQSVVTRSSNRGPPIDLSSRANNSRQEACKILSTLILRLKSPVWDLSRRFLTNNSAGLGRFESHEGSNIGFLEGTLRYYGVNGVGEEDDFICQAMVMLLLARIEHGWSASTSVQQLSIWKATSKPCFSNEPNLWQRPINNLITFGGLLETTLSHADNYDSFCRIYPQGHGRCSRRSSTPIGYLHLFSEQAAVQWAFCSPQYGNAAAKLIRYLYACDSTHEAKQIANKVYRAATTELEKDFSSKVLKLV